jgi:hypothetical protein
MAYRRSLVILWMLALTACAVALAGCASMTVGSDYDRAASFPTTGTFTLMHRDHHDTQNPLVATRAEDAIRAQLTSKGYREADDPAKADFSVDFTIGAKERTDINSYPAAYAGGGWGRGNRGWWGGSYWGDNLDVRQYKEGTLSIDIFDTRTHRPVWHGWAKKELTRKDIEQSEQPIRRAVSAVLAKFPPA